MDIKLATLQRKLSASEKREKYLKERVSVWRSRALKEREMLKSAIIQYERIIKQWKKMYEDVIGNGWKILFTKVINWYNKKRGNKVF